MTGCEQMEELLPRYADGEAAPAEREPIEEHLGRCDDCRTMLHALRDVDAVIAALPVVPESMRLRLPVINAGVRRGMERRGPRLPVLPLWGRAWSIAASVAFVLFIGAVTLVLSSALSQMQQATQPGPTA